MVAAEVHDEAQGGAPCLRDLAESRFQPVHLGLRLLADRGRLGLGLGRGLFRAGGLLARGIRLLARARGLRFRELPAFRGRARRRLGGARPFRRLPGESGRLVGLGGDGGELSLDRLRPQKDAVGEQSEPRQGEDQEEEEEEEDPPAAASRRLLFVVGSQGKAGHDISLSQTQLFFTSSRAGS